MARALAAAALVAPPVVGTGTRATYAPLMAAGGGPAVVGVAGSPAGGAWTVNTAGAVSATAPATRYGDLSGIRLARPVVGMASTPSGRGYWLVASDGGIFAFGDARFFGSTGGIRLDRPVVGMASTTTARGYWLVASDGGIFSFGDARFEGSIGGGSTSTVVGMAPTAGGAGYWVAKASGQVMAFGAAPRYPAISPGAGPVVSMAAAGTGYWLATATGRALSFGVVPWAPTPVRLAQARPAADLTVAWTPSPRPPAPSSTDVGLFATAGPAGTRTGWVAGEHCGPACASVTFRDLTPGVTYKALVWAHGALGQGPAGTSNLVTVADTCPGTGACVTVDATRAAGPADRAASGILHSVAAGPSQDYMGELGVTAFRSVVACCANGVDWSRWDAAMSSSAHPAGTMLLSDLWSEAYGVRPVTPWSDWAGYSRWVSDEVRYIESVGETPDYWEVYNEPDLPSGYYPAAEVPSVTTARLLQQFLVAYQAIRSVDPSARVIGPSLAHFAAWPGEYHGPGPDLSTFLAFAAAHHIQLAAVVWHENGPNLLNNDASPLGIQSDVAYARWLLARYPAFARTRIDINEYGSPQSTEIPGWDVGYLSALTSSRVDSAGRSCWNGDCWTPSLDGLLSADSVPLPVFYNRLQYAAMTGSMVSTSTSDDHVTAVGSWDPATGTLRALVGRAVGYAPGPAAPVSVHLVLPVTAGSVSVTVADISGASPGLPAAGAQPVSEATESSTAAGPSSSTVEVPIPAFPDGDAYTIDVSTLG